MTAGLASHRRVEGWLKAAFALACTVLALSLLWRADHPRHAFQTDRINKDLGLWSLRFLFACLGLSPMSRLARMPSLRRWRRTLGLAAFAFAALHTVHFILWGRLWPDHLGMLFLRPYLAVGLAALVAFVPLALTSTDAAVRWMAPRRWRRLHLAVYLIAVLSVTHEVMAYGPLRGEAGLYCALAVVFVGAKLTRLAAPKSRRASPSGRRPNLLRPEAAAPPSP